MDAYDRDVGDAAVDREGFLGFVRCRWYRVTFYGKNQPGATRFNADSRQIG
jgi:hypothetical protein